MCKRNTNDPLLRTLLDQYNLNLLSIPRTQSNIGDLYVHDGKRTSTPGSVTYFLDPPFQIPKINAGEIMADVVGQVSNSISINVGLGLLEGFLTSLGAAPIVSKIRGSYEANNAKSMRFRFRSPTRDWVDAMLLGSRLTDHKIKEGHALYNEGYRYYVTTAVVRSPSISILALTEDARSVDINLEAIKVAEISSGLSINRSKEGEITYAGQNNLVFGIELYELLYDLKRRQLRLQLTDLIQTRAPGIPVPPARPTFIGGMGDDAFIIVD